MMGQLAGRTFFGSIKATTQMTESQDTTFVCPFLVVVVFTSLALILKQSKAEGTEKKAH